MDEIWLVWVQDGEYGDPERQQVARRSEEGAKRWCNENRKLEGGDPIQWVPSCRTRQRVVGTCMVPYYGSVNRKDRKKRYYVLERLEVKD